MGNWLVMGFILDGSDAAVFELIDSNLNEAVGEEVNYYSLNKDKSKIDPVYGEFIDRKIDGPWRLPAIFKKPEQTPIAGEAGWTVEFKGICHISRVHFEQNNAPYPVEGDIIEVWRSPFHNADSLGQGLFLNIIQVNNRGHVNDSSSFVEFELILVRRPQMGAERLISPP